MDTSSLGVAPFEAVGERRSAGPEAHAIAIARPRLDSVDLVRGLVMVVMAIDHVRDMLGAGHFDPADLTRTNLALFATRWITHLCAPAFVLLAGTGAFLSKKPRGALSRFLLTRGLWLVVAEITLVKVAWTFNLSPFYIPLQVIWAIGWSMVALAALVWLPMPVVALFGVAMIATHNLLDGATVGPLLDRSAAHPAVVGTLRDFAVSVLHVQNYPVIYPLIPWIGVIAAGYALGPVFLREPASRRRTLIVLGCCLCAVFFIVRGLNGYGDPHPWAKQPGALFTGLSFLNTTKYPPSLDYLAMTLGPILLLLAFAERLRGPLAAALVVFGRVPFFFYVLHLYLIHAAALALGVWTGFGVAPFLQAWPAFPKTFGLTLGGVYLAWALVVLSLYPACRWFARVKATRRDWWLSYL